MNNKLLLLLVLTFLFCINTYSQQFNIGFKIDATKYVWIERLPPYNGESSVSTSLAGFLKFGVLFFNKLELELDGGYQLGDRFGGVEAAFLAKYRFWNNIFPFISYFNHQNDGHEGTGTGTSSYTYNLFGAGVELKLTKVFSVDIGYYYPIGKRGYDYEYLSTETVDLKYTNTSQIGSFLRLGTIFSFSVN